MPEVTVSSLELDLQKQVENARAAFDGEHPERALELCRAVLEVQPACLTVRKLGRASQLKLARQRGMVSKFVTAVSSAPFLLGGGLKLKNDPESALRMAERLLQRDPHNVAALELLGQAAVALGWTETAIFAHEAASDLDPERPDIWLALGGAYLMAGRTTDAVAAAKQAMLLRADDAEAQALLRDAAAVDAMTNGKWAQREENQGKVVADSAFDPAI